MSFEFWWFFSLLGIGYFVGHILEQRHYRSIRQRERFFNKLPAVTLGKKNITAPRNTESQIFTGSVVVSIDYFKRIAASLRNLVGGRVKSYESLLDRGRREAILRMKADAAQWGANQITNVRFETTSIGGNTTRDKALGSIEVIAYGTGIKSYELRS